MESIMLYGSNIIDNEIIKNQNNTTDYILETRDIHKRYSGVNALNGINFKIRRGEVHALVGENGAGKSTLIKLLTGAISPTKGSIIFEGQMYNALNPSMALQLGITAIYQEFNLIPYLSVAENIFFGSEKMKNGLVDFNEMNRLTIELFKQFDLKIDPKMKIQYMGVAQQQLVEIVKATTKNAKLIIMDEPSAPLTEKETETLYRIVKQLKEKKITIIYISHRLEEVFEICDRVTVLRDGNYISTNYIHDTNRDLLIADMVGRKLREAFPRTNVKRDRIILEVVDVNNRRLNHVSLRLYKGEILGIGGLVGAGRTELARAIYGADKIDSGRIILKGVETRIDSPKDALKKSIALLPEDRKTQGVIMGMDIKSNITLAIIKKISKFSLLRFKQENKICTSLVDDLSIKINSLQQPVNNLSGGNQQKVVLAKCLATKGDILIIDEPTRGIDVGTKQEIYKIMRTLADSGKSIIMISSEMEELIGMSDRILVMRNGKIVKELYPPEFSQEAILNYASL